MPLPWTVDRWPERLDPTVLLLPAISFWSACIAAVLLHEWSHVVAMTVLARSGSPGGSSRGCLAGNLSAGQLALQPITLLLGWPASIPHVRVSTTQLSQNHVFIVRHCGWLFSVLLAVSLTLCSCCSTHSCPWSHETVQAVLIAVWMVAAGAVSSDLLQCQPARDNKVQNQIDGGAAQQTTMLFCGNLGLLIAGVTNSTVDFRKVLRMQIAISMQRGAQSGGIMTFAGASRKSMRLLPHRTSSNISAAPAPRPVVLGISRRCAPRKRDNLSAAMGRKMEAALRGKTVGGPVGHAILAGHTRFATSSLPSEVESHPHQWTPQRPEQVWRANMVAGRLEAQIEMFGVWITHNGDLDFFKLLGAHRTHHDIAAGFLEPVLGCKAPAKCDSVVVAGMLEYLRCQGRWYASMRLAFYDTTDLPFTSVKGAKQSSTAARVNDEESGAGDTAPTARQLQAFAAALEEAMQQHLASIADINLSRDPSLEVQLDKAGLMHEPDLCKHQWELRWGSLVVAGAEAQCMQHLLGGSGGVRRLQSYLTAVAEAYIQCIKEPWTDAVRDAALLVAAAVANFLCADLYAATVRFLRGAKGSFGLAVTCTLDPDREVLAAWGQPMTVAFSQAHSAVLYSSESQNVMVPLLSKDVKPDLQMADSNGWRPGMCTHRMDIDEGAGEVLLLVLHHTQPPDVQQAGSDYPCDVIDGWSPFEADRSTSSYVTLRLHRLRDGTEVSGSEELRVQGRWVDLVNHSCIRFPEPHLLEALAHPGKVDLVAGDLADIPGVLVRIRDSFNDSFSSLNQRSAEALFQHVLAMHETRRISDNNPDPLEVDVLLVGVEVSLWVAEAAANDLRLLFPKLRVLAISANKVISALGNSRGRIPSSGSAFCALTCHLGQHTICIAVSQSGQTFPTIHATRILTLLLPGRVFIMCGQMDTKMAVAIGQRFSSDAVFTERIFCTFAGWRSAEPASVVVVAMHQTFTELWFYLAARFADQCFVQVNKISRPGHMTRSGPLGMSVNPDQLLDLRIVRDRFIEEDAPQLTGHDAKGAAVASPAHALVVAQGRKWALHVTETPKAWLLSLAHILVTVVSGWPLLFAIAHGSCLLSRASGAGCSASTDLVISKCVLVLDCVLYMCLPWLYGWLLRLLQGRPLLHRFGKRTLVIADVPLVHQVVESYVSKLWALSFGMVSLEVHGAAPQDHFVHRFTHRVTRGLLLAVGRPDGRLYSQAKHEAATLLAVLQAKVIQHLGGQPEVVSIGHNSYHPTTVVDINLVLPCSRPPLLVEVLEQSNAGGRGHDGADPNALWAERRHLATSGTTDPAKLQRLAEVAKQLVKFVEVGATPLALQQSSTTKEETSRSHSPAVHDGGASAAWFATPAGDTLKPCETLQHQDSTGFDGLAITHSTASFQTGLTSYLPSMPRSKTLHLGRFPGLRRSTAKSHAQRQRPGELAAVLSASRLLPILSQGRSVAHALLENQTVTVLQLTCRDLIDFSSADLKTVLAGCNYVVGQHLVLNQVLKDTTKQRDLWKKTLSLARVARHLRDATSEDISKEALAALGSSYEDMLGAQSVVEQLIENRYDACSRLISFFVMFHAMAARTSQWWPLTFDISRSQSGLRIATTAAPTTASDLERSVAEMRGVELLEQEHMQAQQAFRRKAYSALLNKARSGVTRRKLESMLATAPSNNQRPASAVIASLQLSIA